MFYLSRQTCYKQQETDIYTLNNLSEKNTRYNIEITRIVKKCAKNCNFLYYVNQHFFVSCQLKWKSPGRRIRSYVSRVFLAGDDSFEGPQNNLINKIGIIVIKKYCNLEI